MRLTFLLLLLPGCALPTAAPPAPTDMRHTAGATGTECDTDNGGLSLPAEFCAVLVGSTLGPVRELAVAPNGDLYAAVKADGEGRGGGVLAFRDTSGDGRPDLRESFGPGGGNDVEVRDGHLYFARNGEILRWRLAPGRLAPEGDAETIVSGLPADGGHVAKSIAFDGDLMYVNVGSRTNSCQANDRVEGSPGHDPCSELDRRAGIWTFSATRTGQTFDDGTRFATGLRNAMALAVHPRSRALFAAVHGRDQLAQNWGFSAEINANNPAEIFVRVARGDDFGWPYCHYSNEHQRTVLSPEYGGDGAEQGRCAAVAQPLVAFPGHWAPLALVFYESDAFGEKYRRGAFIAWHGSWNRAPLPQEGYRVTFVPFRGDDPAGDYETFASDAGAATGLRASGLAVAPDGALYIAADQNAKIWRVMRR
ncbi:MAG TPA: PQQ-dependent sugar dehydrogenase [Gemmatimonadales bacterium]|nr:PQQ-dependent sugar dehydrogenase [Gemmatimonadales bacterium]